MLTETEVKALKPAGKPYKVADERGLFLLVATSGSRLWRLKYRFAGREKLLAIGAYPDVSLKSARNRRDEARKQIADGVDPSEKKQADRAATADTFKAIAAEWLKLNRKSYHQKTITKAEWLLDDWLNKAIGNRPIREITAPAILSVCRKLEARGNHETAHRARSLASRVFRFAIATGRADRDPTMDLRGALAPVGVKHHAAVTEPKKIGELLRAIAGYQGHPSTIYALRLAPLVFVRPGELRRAEWSEFDLDRAVWRIPGARMKMGDPHLVPLSRQAVTILRELERFTGDCKLLFPSLRSKSRPISDNTVNAALRRLGYAQDEMTGHGFRSMASTVLNEQGWHPDLIELQLAHAERNKVRAAYNRAQRIAERTEMMQAWSDYLDGLKAGADIVTLRRKA